MKRKDKYKSGNKKPETEDNDTNKEKWYRSLWVWIYETTCITDWFILFCTIVIAGVGICQWNTLKGQLETFNRQLDETTAQFHSSHRPWCAVIGEIKTIKSLKIKSNKITFTIKLSVKNGGTTPAFRESVQNTVHVGTINDIISYSRKHNPCNEEVVKSFTSIMGETLLPGETSETSPSKISVNVPDISSTKGAVLVDICISYRDEFGNIFYTGDRWHYVGANNEQEYLLRGNIPGRWESFNVGGTVK